MERDCPERSLSRASLSNGRFLQTQQVRSAGLQSASWVVFARAYVRSMRLYYSFVTGIAGWLGVAYYEYLAANPGRVFSRTMIIEHVWDQSFEGLTNIVDVYVSHLRGKVDDPFPTKLIRTVRGAGYSIDEAPP